MEMNVKDYLKKSLSDLSKISSTLSSDPNLKLFVEVLATSAANSIKKGQPILLAGNGGSFADAMHTAAEFTGRLVADRAPFPAVVLGSNPCSMTAISNDYSYEDVFSREIFALARSASVILVFSTSGNSPSINKLLLTANDLGLQTFALLGRQGGESAKISTSYVVPSNSTTLIQEIHMSIAHVVCQIVEEKLQIG